MPRNESTHHPMPVIQPYTDQNKQQVADLIVSIQQNEFGIPITLQDQPDLNDIPHFYQSNNGNFWTASVDDNMVGTIALLDIGNQQAALRKMFVSKNHRGKSFNIGQSLLDTLLHWATNRQFKEIFLGTTAQFIAAQRFYEKNGFIEIEKKQLPLQFPVMQVDVKFYRYDIHLL